MYNKMTLAMYNGYCTAKRKFKNLMDEESGMETLETIILIAVAVIVAGFLINLLTKDGFTDSDGKSCGLIGYIFGTIKSKLDEVFA